MRLHALSTLAVAVAIVTVAAEAGAQTVDEQTEFKKGRYAYAAKSYVDADALFRKMLDPKTGTLRDKVLINEARMYWGATLIATGRKEQAMEQFDALLASDPKYEPDPTVFPLDVGRVFIDAQALYKKRLIEAEEEAKLSEKQKREREEAAKKAQIERLRQLEILVGEEHVIDHHSRWIALLPFGVGQFQNGKNGLGAFFLSAESLMLAGGIVTVPIYLYQLGQVRAVYQGVTDQGVAAVYDERANEARYANLIFYGALAVTAVAGVIEAQVSYVPDVSGVRPRKLPDLPGVSPDAKPPKTSLSLTFGAAPVFGGEGKGGVSGAVVGVGGLF